VDLATAATWISMAGGLCAMALVASRIISRFSKQEVEQAVTVKQLAELRADTERDLNDKANKHEVLAVSNKVDTVQLLIAQQMQAQGRTLDEIKAGLDGEHKTRRDQYETIAVALSRLSQELAVTGSEIRALDKRVTVIEGTLQARRESDKPAA
jgi:hypothetical protein